MGDGFITRRGLGSGSSGDLSNYYNKSEVDSLLADKVDKVAGKKLVNVLFGSWTPKFVFYSDAPILVISPWVDAEATYSTQYGSYILIEDLCFINFRIKGTFAGSGQIGKHMGFGPLPFDINSNDAWQPLTLGACIQCSSSDDSQLWTPTAGIIAKAIPHGLMSSGTYAGIYQNNGYIESPWPNDTSNPYYIEGSGVYKIKSSNSLGDQIDTSGSSVPPVGEQS